MGGRTTLAASERCTWPFAVALAAYAEEANPHPKGRCARGRGREPLLSPLLSLLLSPLLSLLLSPLPSPLLSPLPSPLLSPLTPKKRCPSP